MTLLEKLIEKNKEVKKFEEEHLFCRNSKDEFAISKQTIQSAIKHLDYSPLTQEEAKEVLGRQWKKNLQNICYLYSFLQRSKFYSENNPVMISTTLYKQIKVDGKQVFKDDTVLRRCIEVMKKIKAIYCVDSHYAKDIQKARIYLLADNRIKSCFHFFAEDTDIWEKYDNHNINNHSINNDYYNEVLSSSNDDEMSSRYIKLDLYKLINQTNRGASDLFKYKATGWRPSANICYVPSKEKQHKIQHDVYREDLIPFKYQEFDRNASIYNLMLFLGKGEIRENDRSKYDFYTEFAKRLQCIEYGHIISKSELEAKISSSSLQNKLEDFEDFNVRDCVKTLMMTINFASKNQVRALIGDSINYLMSGDNRCFNKFRKFQQRLICVIRLLDLESFQLKDVEGYLKLSKVLYYFFCKAKDLLKDYVGREIEDKTIFLYEAAVNLNTQKLIKDAGFNCVSVYDGFYTDCSEDFWWDCYKKSLFYLRTLSNKEE